MTGPYFQRRRWAAFVYGGAPVDFDHLNEYELTVEDSAGVKRRIAVTFSDHVFTRKPVEGDDPRHVYPGSDRQFCPIRYRHSLDIRALIQWCANGDAWHLDGDHYAHIPTVDEAGRPMHYAIVFSLDAASGVPVDLHMRIRSAYPCDRGSPPATYGSVKFKRLVTLVATGRRPPKVPDRRRKRPQLGKARLPPRK
jgi:hypothetical protein